MINKVILLVLLLLLLTSCSSNKQMREDFGSEDIHILQDISTLKYYSLKHSLGNNYIIRPLENNLKQLVISKKEAK